MREKGSLNDYGIYKSHTMEFINTITESTEKNPHWRATSFSTFRVASSSSALRDTPVLR